MGWHDPDKPDSFLIPTHHEILFIDRLALHQTGDPAEAVRLAYNDPNGTVEQALMFKKASSGELIGYIPYGSQMTTLAHFLEINGALPEGMDQLYAKPKGGVRVVKAQRVSALTLTRDRDTIAAGESVRLHATMPGSATYVYRFGIAKEGEPSRLVRDFSAVADYSASPLMPGRYTVKVEVAKQGSTSVLGSTTATFDVTLAQKGVYAMATPHPMVALVGVSTCTPGAWVQAHASIGDTTLARSALLPCSNDGAALLLGGLKESTAYTIAVTQTLRNAAQTLGTATFTTTPSGVDFPSVAIDRYTMEDSPKESVTLMSAFPTDSHPLAFAVDMEGATVWYYPHFKEEEAVLTRMTPQGNLLLLVNRDTIHGDILKEVDLRGYTVRLKTASKFREELAARGFTGGVGLFDHEAVYLPNGHLALQVSYEKSVDATKMLGALIVVLDADWQVAWVWDSFKHLDTSRGPILGETCRSSDVLTTPGCPTLLTFTTASDWLHGNHIAYSPEDGALLYSLRNQDWIIKINYADGAGDGSVLWRLGAEGDFTLAGGGEWFSHQHGAQLVSRNKLVVFDNGNTRCASAGTTCVSRGELYQIDENTKTASKIASLDMPAYAMALGNAERLLGGEYSFTTGLIMEKDFSGAKVVRTSQNGTTSSILSVGDTNLYRAFPLPSLGEPTQWRPWQLAVGWNVLGNGLGTPWSTWSEMSGMTQRYTFDGAWHSDTATVYPGEGFFVQSSTTGWIDRWGAVVVPDLATLPARWHLLGTGQGIASPSTHHNVATSWIYDGAWQQDPVIAHPKSGMWVQTNP